MYELKLTDWITLRNPADLPFSHCIQVREYLRRGQSVNLVVKGEPRRREILEQLRDDLDGGLVVVDMDSGAAASGRHLVAAILKACGTPARDGTFFKSPTPDIIMWPSITK